MLDWSLVGFIVFDLGIRVLKGGRRLGIRWWEWRRSDGERRGGGWVIVENKRVGDIFNDAWASNMSFSVQFPRLFALKTDKSATVDVKWAAPSFDSSFRRLVRDGVEREQWLGMLSFLNSVSLSPSNDRWVCDLNDDGDFRVKDIRSYLDDMFLPSLNTDTRWIKYIPLKVNVFAWRARLDRLPTRLNLNRRGAINLVPCEDRYFWSLESEGNYSVASIRKLIDEKRFQEVALGWNLKQIHVTWANLKKKQTRLRLYTIYLEELCMQSVETASRSLSDGVRIFKVTTSWIWRRCQDVADLKWLYKILRGDGEVILFYNGLDVPTRQILDSKGAIPTKTAVDAKIAMQEMAKYFQKWHNRTSTKNRTGSGFYQRNNRNSSYPDRGQTMEGSLDKFMAESAKRHEDNSNIIKEIRASTDAAIKNQRASIKTLEIQIGQTSKVLQEKGFERASVSVMSFSTYTNLGLRDLAHTRLTIELANRTIKHPMSIAEKVLVRIGKFIFPIDFIILDIPEDNDVPLLLGRPFLSTAHAKIDVFKIKFTLRVGEEKLVFKSIKLATSIIRRVYMLKDETNLDSKTELIEEAVNESFDPDYGFSIIDDMDVTSGVVLGMPFYKKFMTCQKIMEKFARRDECEQMKDE
nr:RNA-directed DNA polymerase, eukaryota [Tanacetum cinerariifolium]